MLGRLTLSIALFSQRCQTLGAHRWGASAEQTVMLATTFNFLVDKSRPYSPTFTSKASAGDRTAKRKEERGKIKKSEGKVPKNLLPVRATTSC